jgi:hypothetical protein
MTNPTVTIDRVEGPQPDWADLEVKTWTDDPLTKPWTDLAVQNYSLLIEYDLGFSESTNRAVGSLIWSESFSISDNKVTNSVSKLLATAIAFNETYTDIINFLLRVEETVGFAEVAGTTQYLPVEEMFGVGSGFNMDINKNVDEEIAFAEIMANVVTFLRSFESELSFTEATNKLYDLDIPEETITFVEEQIRRANAVFSDLKVGEGDVDQKDFEARLRAAAPVGFDRFRNYQPGDYKFQKILVRHIFRAFSVDQPRMSELKTVVDVPDITDRGEVSLLAAEKFVTFNRAFAVPPEVTATLKGGTVFAIPRITDDITNEGFNICLVDANNNMVAGKISWKAEGY